MKSTMSISVDTDILPQFDEILKKDGQTRSERVNAWVREFVERYKAMPELSSCAKHNVRYAKSLPICPQCAIDNERDAAAKAEADRVLSAKAVEDKLEQKFQEWVNDKSERGGFSEYLDHVGSQGFESWKAEAKKKLGVEE